MDPGSPLRSGRDDGMGMRSGRYTSVRHPGLDPGSTQGRTRPGATGPPQPPWIPALRCAPAGMTGWGCAPAGMTGWGCAPTGMTGWGCAPTGMTGEVVRFGRNDGMGMRSGRDDGEVARSGQKGRGDGCPVTGIRALGWIASGRSGCRWRGARPAVLRTGALQWVWNYNPDEEAPTKVPPDPARGDRNESPRRRAGDHARDGAGAGG
jgi:hypothetical protein